MKFTSLFCFLFFSLSAAADQSAKAPCPDPLNVEMRKLHSKQRVNLCDFFKPDKPLLIVNTASHCGYTKQFAGLEALYKQYQEQGLVILGFPSDSFNQEEDSEAATARICYTNYGVTFPMFEHLSVKGEGQHPLFAYLTARSKEPGWNFNKYLLINGEVSHFSSKVKPQASPLEEAIKARL